MNFCLETGSEASRIVTEGGRVAGVETSRGRIATPVVVAVLGGLGRAPSRAARGSPSAFTP